AAPVTRAILEAAIAARNAALDRGRLASSVVPKKGVAAGALAVQQAGTSRAPASRAGSPNESESVPFVVTLPLRREAPPARVAHVVPDVRGMGLRDAVRSLHNAGFHVQLTRADRPGSPAAASTSPAPGEMAPAGSVVRLVIDF